ncbi:MAG: PRC-barrel domain-containing protein [Agrobacterium tumefaciens]
MKTSHTALALILAAGAPAMANSTAPDNQASQVGDRASQNASAQTGQIDQYSASAFSRWDANNNDRLDDGEFSQGLHQNWSGESGELDQAAFESNWGNWFSSERPDFSEIDENSDDRISETELRAALADTDLRGNWQGAEDGYLTREKFQAGVNAVGDRNRDGSLDQAEVDAVVSVIAVVAPDQTETASTQQDNVDNTITQTGQQQASAGNRAQNDGELRVGEIIPLRDWDTDTLHDSGWTAEALFGRTVYGSGGEEIGDVEDLIIGANGDLVALVAEVGGIWDIGDTHVSVPWDQVSFREDRTVTIPVTEDNADDFSVINELRTGNLSENVASGLDDEELGPRVWRASELIGDIARIRGAQAGMETGDVQNNAAATTQNEQAAAATGDAQGRNDMAPGSRLGYGYVEDIVFQNDKVAAAIVNRDAGYGTRGRYAYPFYGYGYGWAPGSRYYDLPYSRDDSVTLTPFDYDRINEG